MSEEVNHPDHYNRGGIEAIEAIEAWGLGFCLGNVVKYVARAGYKDGSTREKDLRKALWYLEYELGMHRKVQSSEGDQNELSAPDSGPE